MAKGIIGFIRGLFRKENVASIESGESVKEETTYNNSIEETVEEIKKDEDIVNTVESAHSEEDESLVIDAVELVPSEEEERLVIDTVEPVHSEEEACLATEQPIFVSNESGNKDISKHTEEHPFVDFIEENHNVIFGPGAYVAGDDIKQGEYYVYGKQISYEIEKGKRHESYSFEGDTYVKLRKGTHIILQAGFMTPVENLIYKDWRNKAIVPGHVYCLEKEIVYGLYQLVFKEEHYRYKEGDKSFDKRTVNLYHSNNLPAHSWTSQYEDENSNSRPAYLGENYKYVYIENGEALFCVPEINCQQDITKFVTSTLVGRPFSDEPDQFYSKGLTLLDHLSYKVKIYKNSRTDCYLDGNNKIKLAGLWLYSVNNKYYVTMFIYIDKQPISSVEVLAFDKKNRNIKELISLHSDGIYFSGVISVPKLRFRDVDFEIVKIDVKEKTAPLPAKYAFIPHSNNMPQVNTYWEFLGAKGSCSIPYDDADSKILKPFSGIVGKDITEGEYYLWGDNLVFQIANNQEDSSFKYIRNSADTYVNLRNGDTFTLIAGRMINIRYINYRLVRRYEKMHEGHTYKLGLELPYGKYISDGTVEISQKEAYKDADYSKVSLEFNALETVQYLRIKSGETLLVDEIHGDRIQKNYSVADIKAECISLVKSFTNKDFTSKWLDDNAYYNTMPYITEWLRYLRYRVDNFEPAPIDRSLQFAFAIWALYNKSYFVMAKAADTAVSVMCNKDESRYTVIIDGEHLNELEAFTYSLKNTIAQDPEAWEYVKKRNVQYDVIEYIKNKKHAINNTFYTEIYDAILDSMRGEIRLRLQKMYDELYSEGRIPSKWGREYRLFRVIKHYVQDAEYQYSDSWLNGQSIDIYIPSQKIGIEYQGEQHYKPVDYFGGKETFDANKRRDQNKKESCEGQGVKLLYWKYDISVTTENVEDFLDKNSIKKHIWTREEIKELTSNKHAEMAPRLDSGIRKNRSLLKRTQDRVSSTTYVIQQFSEEGKLVNEYTSYLEAAEGTGLSIKGIQKATRGERYSAGGYQWRRTKADEKTTEIAPLQRPHYSSERKTIVQIDENGEIIAHFDSIRDAENVTSVSRESISAVLHGRQKMAGGYYWAETNLNPDR